MTPPRRMERLLFGRPTLYRAKRFLIEDVIWKRLLSGLFGMEPHPLPETLPEIEGGRVLLAACGPGHVTTGPMPERAGQVVAFDLSRRFATRCAETRPGWRVYCGNLEQLPHPDRAFDTGLLYSSLHHLPFGAERAIAELSRVCHKLVIVEGVVPPRGLLRHLLLIWYRLVDGGHRYYTEEELTAMAERQGLRVQRASRHGPIRHMWLATLARPEAGPAGAAGDARPS